MNTEPMNPTTKPSKNTIPPDPENLNDLRAEWAESALYAFEAATGSDREDSISDLVSDLAHFCDRKQIDLVEEIRRGLGHYCEETAWQGAPRVATLLNPIRPPAPPAPPAPPVNGGTHEPVNPEPPVNAPDEVVISDDAFRCVAREQYGDEGSVEIDPNAAVSRSSDGGAYVQAWVFVRNGAVTGNPADNDREAVES